MAVKPSEGHLDWTLGEPSKVTDPGAGKKLLGWTASERPPFQFMNFLFYVIDKWIKWAEAELDVLVASNLEYDAVVGIAPGATHASLSAAVADAGLASGVKVLVLDSEALSSTVQLTKDRWEIIFKPGVDFSDSGAGTGIKVSADRISLIGGRFTGFTKAIEIEASSDYTLLQNPRFASNTADVDDLSSTSVISGQIPE